MLVSGSRALGLLCVGHLVSSSFVVRLVFKHTAPPHATTSTSTFLIRELLTRCLRRTDQLEEKLNGLVDLLRASGDIPALNQPENLTLESATDIDAQCACLPSDRKPPSLALTQMIPLRRLGQLRPCR